MHYMEIASMQDIAKKHLLLFWYLRHIIKMD